MVLSYPAKAVIVFKRMQRVSKGGGGSGPPDAFPSTATAGNQGHIPHRWKREGTPKQGDFQIPSFTKTKQNEKKTKTEKERDKFDRPQAIFFWVKL